ncbi:MAG: hypothetical protein DYG98_24365 [Haliscomenobacteraceae bacterium CHB4]|nr:hypothetical protein [Saprospiraceae bacterium]MCE7926193.1 hypothetical protein [Haliscomenobacteraceae bacterium CHB4]
MDLQSFIQSGLLEAYALGQCTAEERALVERMVAEHAEARAELASIEKSLEGYASANAVPPPAWMKGRILEVIENEANTPAPPPPPAAPGARSGILPLRVFQLLALGFALLALLFFVRENNIVSEKTALENRITGLQQQINDCEQNKRRTDTLRQVVQLLRDRENTRAVALNPATGTGNAVYAYQNANRCQIAIDLATLPASGKGQYYQFWAIEDGKAPVSLGMVREQTASGWQLLPCLDNAITLAISVENNPEGNAQPTEVFRVGNIPAAGG